MDPIKRAIDHLNAKQTADGYVYRDGTTCEYYLITEADLLSLGERLERGERDAYSLWCADTDVERLGRDWKE